MRLRKNSEETKTIGLNSFFLAHHSSKKSTTQISERNKSRLPHLVLAAWDSGWAGYAPGVWIVPVKLSARSPTYKLKPGDTGIVQYKSRVPGEAPRKSEYIPEDNSIKGEIVPYIHVVLYSREKLAENNEDSTGCDWDVITILAALGGTESDTPPMPLTTLLCNHFDMPGGSKTHWSPERFEREIKKSFLYWKDRMTVSKGDLR